MILLIFQISIPHWTLFLRENYLGSLTKNLRHWTNCKGQLIRLEGIVRVLARVLSLYLYFLQIFAPWMVKINNLCCVACIPYSLLKGFWSPMLLKYMLCYDCYPPCRFVHITWYLNFFISKSIEIFVDWLCSTIHVQSFTNVCWMYSIRPNIEQSRISTKIYMMEFLRLIVQLKFCQLLDST